MIAEDEADIRNLVATMCQVWGHTPITFDSGQRAWDWLDQVESGDYNGPMPDFALMDIRMPGYRGDQVAHRIRQISILSNMPIVLMTAFVLSDEERRNMMTQAGVDFIINKPLPDFTQLGTTLHNIIEKKSASKG